MTKMNRSFLLLVLFSINFIELCFSLISCKFFRNPSCLNSRPLSTLLVRNLNRIIFQPEEITHHNEGESYICVTGSDPRAQHVRKILRCETGNTVRLGVLNAGKYDNAIVDWVESEKAPGDPDLRLWLRSSEGASMEDILRTVQEKERPRVDLLLAVPRPLVLRRLLPVISQVGVGRIFLTNAAKVEPAYFGSHLLRPQKRHELVECLVEGLSQSGDTALPEVRIIRRLKIFLEDELEKEFPSSTFARVIAHPEREGEELFANGAKNMTPMRLRDVPAPAEGRSKILIAIGPEGGWDEPYELEVFAKYGFQAVTLGTRILRSDVAVNSLLALAHDWIAHN